MTIQRRCLGCHRLLPTDAFSSVARGPRPAPLQPAGTDPAVTPPLPARAARTREYSAFCRECLERTPGLTRWNRSDDYVPDR